MSKRKQQQQPPKQRPQSAWATLSGRQRWIYATVMLVGVCAGVLAVQALLPASPWQIVWLFVIGAVVSYAASYVAKRVPDGRA